MMMKKEEIIKLTPFSPKGDEKFIYGEGRQSFALRYAEDEFDEAFKEGVHIWIEPDFPILYRQRHFKQCLERMHENLVTAFHEENIRALDKIALSFQPKLDRIADRIKKMECEEFLEEYNKKNKKLS
jgi:hypothetical protein